jgi:lactoylglutathione lyase
MAITRIDKVTVYVSSQAEARKFWTEKVGFVVALEQPMGPNMTWLEVAPPGANLTSLVLYPRDLMLQQHPEMVQHPSLILATDGIEALWKQLKDHGVQVTEIQFLPYGKMFNFNDNDGQPYMVRG